MSSLDSSTKKSAFPKTTEFGKALVCEQLTPKEPPRLPQVPANYSAGIRIGN